MIIQFSDQSVNWKAIDNESINLLEISKQKYSTF